MRIRTKLLCFLLAVVIIPLCALGLYSWSRTSELGRELARGAARTLEANAAGELVQTAEMFGEHCADTLDLLETSLSLTVDAAKQLLDVQSPTSPPRLMPMDSDFDAGTVTDAVLTPIGGSDVNASYDHMVFHLAPGLTRQAALPEMRAMSGLTPFYRTLFANHKSLMQFGYVGLASGLHCAYPGHGGYPVDYDPRRRPWYQNAAAKPGVTWDIMTDAATRQVVASMALALRTDSGRVLGVAGLDIPMARLFLQSDLSRAWSDKIRSMVVSLGTQGAAGQPDLVIVACRDYAQKSRDWTAPVELERIESPDTATLAEVTHELAAGRSGVRRLSYRGEDTLLAFAPVANKRLAVVLAAPREVVVASARLAEAKVIRATSGLAGQIGLFLAGAVALVALLAVAASKTVTKPVRELAEAARKLASGDFSARVTPYGRDELAEMAASFNDMAPQLVERMKLKNDMALAMEVQQHLLPGRPPAMEGMDIAALSLYCDETGGDYFDFLEFAQDDASHADIVIGDVTGHGVSAALFMATGRALLRGRAVGQPGPGALLTEVNDLLCQDTHLTGRFITLFFLRLDRAAKEMVWCRAGHDPGMLYDPAADAFALLQGSGIPLGAVPDWSYEEMRRPWLVPGQVLVLFTDGIHEARNPADDMYGKERMEAVIRREAAGPASAIVNALVADLKEFKAGLPLEDDVTLVVIKATDEGKAG